MPGFEIFGDEERREVGDVLETGVLFRYGFDQARKGHWKAKTFEEELASRLGVKNCLLCSSGSAALSVALAACGVGAGDEVIVPPFTFVATVEAVLMAGAVPVYSEIDETLCLDPDRLEEAIGPRTKAILPVHMCGSMARIDALREFCDQKGLKMIEDACQSVGGYFQGKALGSFGDMGCFSFDSVKTITCGEGGAIVTNDETLFKMADGFSDHGHDHIGNDRGAEHHPIIGTNMRISELNAAVGLAQLRKLDKILQIQRKNKRAIKGALSDMEGVGFRKIPDESGDTATFLTFLFEDGKTAQKASEKLKQAGVDGCFYWYTNNWHYLRQWDHLKRLTSPARLSVASLPNRPDYESLRLPVSDDIVSRTLSMQIKLSWTESDIEQRIERIRKALKE